QVELLPRDMAGGHRLGQRRATPGASRRIMVDDRIGRRSSTQRLPRMTFLAARLLAGVFPQTADPHRLLQPVTRWRLAAVAAVQAEPALQLSNACLHRCHLSRMACLLRQEETDEVVRRKSLKCCAVHRLLGIERPKSCQTEPSAGPSRGRPTPTPSHPRAAYPGEATTWAVTSL